MKCFFNALFIIASCLLSYASHAQDNEHKVELLTEDDGFITSEIYSILQDQKGIIWFGTGENGLMNYDGKKVSILENDISEPNSLSHNNAGNIIIDKDGRIWIGTWGGGLNKFDPTSNKFEHFIHEGDKANSISSNRIQSLYQDRDGTMWFGTYADGLNRFHPQSQTFEHFRNDPVDKKSLSHNRVWAIRDAAPDALWIATSFGVNLFDKNTGTFDTYLPDPDENSTTGENQVRNLLVTRKSRLYVGTQEGLFLFNNGSKTFDKLQSNENIRVGKIYSLIEDKNGFIWAGSDSGLYRIDTNTNIVELINLPQEGTVRIVFEDHSGIIWANSELHGIYKINPLRNFLELKADKLMPPNGLLSSQGNELIIASASSELLKWDANKQILQTLHPGIISHETDPDYKIRQAYMPTLHQSSKNIIWYAQQSYLYKYNLVTNEITEINYPQDHENYKTFEELKDISSDHENNIWIGTYKNGLHIYNDRSKTFRHYMPDSDNPNSLSHPEVLVLYRDREGRMWVGTGKGLNLWDKELNGFQHFFEDANNENSIRGNIIQTIFQDRRGILWVGTKKGLNRYDSSTDRFRHYTIKDGLASDLIRTIIDDEKGNLWVTTSRGLSMIDPTTGSVQNYDQYDGLLGVNYYPDALVQSSNGAIFLSGPRGIDYFYPTKMKNNKSKPNIILTDFKKMGKSVLLDKTYPYVEEIQLSYKDTFFSFEFAALDFYAPKKNQYAYMLEGFDDDWINIGTNNTASYTNLSGGAYIFRVKASNRDGIWNNEGLSIKLIISPPFWDTWWAYVLYVVFTLLGLSLYVRVKTYSQQKELRMQKQFVKALEEQVKDKTASLTEKTNKLEKANFELEKLTYMDGLTGLFNRRFFDQILEQELNLHQRIAKPLTLILCDIDHFKLYNDHLGHLEGDNCIQQVSKCMLDEATRSSDSVCRYGGEEFGIILPNTSQDQAIKIVKKIMNGLAALKILHDTSPTGDAITMSYGICSIIPQQQTTPERMIALADRELYNSKLSGRNRYSLAITTSDCA